MERRVNLSDPEFEPTDEELQGLSRRAFAGVAAAHEASLVRLRAEIASAGRELAREYAARVEGERAR